MFKINKRNININININTNITRTITNNNNLKYDLIRNYYRIEQIKSQRFLSSSSSNHHNSTTVDETEILKFSKLASEWWSPNGPVKLLHSMNPLRISYIREQLKDNKNEYDSSSPSSSISSSSSPSSSSLSSSSSSPSSYLHHLPFLGLRILDIGCGGGVLTEALVRLGGSVIGADASDENIRIAKLHARKDPSLYIGPGNLEYQCITAEELLEQGEVFDVVCAMEIVEHVNNPVEFLKACAGLVKPGSGHLFLSTISRTPLSYLLTILLAENVFKLVPQGTHEYQKYLKPNELQKVIEEEIMKNEVDDDKWGQVKNITGIGLNPITNKWCQLPNWIPGKLDVNYFLTAKRF